MSNKSKRSIYSKHDLITTRHNIIRDQLAKRGIKIGHIKEGSFIGGKPWVKTSTIHINGITYKAGQKFFWHCNDYNEDYIITISGFMIYDNSIDILPKTAIMIDENGKRSRNNALGRISLNDVELVK